MATLLQCTRLAVTVGARRLFEEIDLTIAAGDRIGLVGHNGSGKSTLLALLDGRLSVDTGSISRSRDLRLATVEQFIAPELHELTLQEALAGRLAPEERTSEAYRVERLLDELGFAEEEFGQRVADLSGGQQNRLMFARAVLGEPNLVLFDEPTNHLDLATTLQFEDFLTTSLDAGFIVISHDRHFLDAVTNRTLFLRDGRLWSFALPYSRAAEALADQDAAAAATRRSEERNIQQLKESARRLATWGKVYDNEKFARKAKSMEKRIEKLEEAKTFVSRGSDLQLTLEVTGSRVGRMLHVEDLSVMSPGASPEPLFHVELMTIRPGDRVALLGVNGAGKTTLIKRLLEEQARGIEGNEIRFNPQCRIGYYDQELALLDPRSSMIEVLRQACDGTESEYSAALIQAGFPYEELEKPVAVLSGGERARLMFLVIRLNRPNFLILDEPTNHIDIAGKEELEAQILESDATVLITSHDRRFVDNIATRYLLIDEGHLQELHDPAEFYRSPHSRRAPLRAPEKETSAARSSGESPRSQEEILERILLLEEKLAADLARKPRHQKPRLQEGWRAELDALHALLE